MESAGLRHRDKQKNETAKAASVRDASSTTNEADAPLPPPPSAANEEDAGTPPRFTVDLSLPPSQRYSHIAPHLRQTLDNTDLQGLFDELIAPFAPGFLGKCVRTLARLVLRRVYSSEETAELKGIARATGVKLYLLVAFNVLLDLLLGCTSGGVRVEEAPSRNRPSTGPGSGGNGSRMLHFRTLDWGMDPLRSIVVELDFVRRQGGPVIATSVTYFGYVGVLTGVRKGLSLSLNFRPHHDATTRRKELAFRWQHLMVLLGLRRSISSVLRGILFTPDAELDGSLEEEQTPNGQKWRNARRSKAKKDDAHTPIIEYIKTTLPSEPSTAAYLIFCTPSEVYSLEKDNRAGTLASSDVFLTTYNHDREDEANPAHLQAVAQGLSDSAIGMEAIVAYSIDRKNRLDRKYSRAVKRHCKLLKRNPTDGPVGMQDVVELLSDEHISNEETHYAVIMDPSAGSVVWRKVFPPPEEPDLGQGWP